MNKFRSRFSVIMSLTVSLLAFFAALNGLLNENLYLDPLKAGNLTNFLVAGSLAQDIISILLAVTLALLVIVFFKNPNLKIFIFIQGVTAYFFYGYGLYAIQGQYTAIYLVYLTIFSLSVYSLMVGLTSFEHQEVANYYLSARMCKVIASFLFFILVVLVPLWIFLISGDIANHLPSDTYGVFVLDLCIVFPALGVTGVMLLRNIPLGRVFAGIALFKVFTVCLSVAFGEWFGPIYGGFKTNYGNLTIFTTLSCISLVLIILYIKSLKKMGCSNN